MDKGEVGECVWKGRFDGVVAVGEREVGETERERRNIESGSKSEMLEVGGEGVDSEVS